MNRKLTQVLTGIVAVTALTVGITATKPISAYSVNEVFNPYVLNERLEDAVPEGLDINKTRLIKILGNKFIDSIDIIDTDTAYELEDISLNIDGRSKRLNQRVLMDDGRIYLSVNDMSTLLTNYIGNPDNFEKVLTVTNVKNAYNLARGTTSAISSEGRVYIPIKYIADNLDLILEFEDGTIDIYTDNL